MRITLEWLRKHKVFKEDIRFIINSQLLGLPAKTLIKCLIKLKSYRIFIGLIDIILSKRNHIEYSIYAAELVLPIFEKEYPEDNRPRKAINAAKEYIINPNERNKDILSCAIKDTLIAYRLSFGVDYTHPTVYATQTSYKAYFGSTVHAAEYAAFTIYCAAGSATYFTDDDIYVYGMFTIGYAMDAAFFHHDIIDKILAYGLNLINEEEVKK